MPNSIQDQKRRDKYEKDLDALLERIKALNETTIRSKEDFQKALNTYKDWKELHKIEGIKY